MDDNFFGVFLHHGGFSQLVTAFFRKYFIQEVGQYIVFIDEQAWQLNDAEKRNGAVNQYLETEDRKYIGIRFQLYPALNGFEERFAVLY